MWTRRLKPFWKALSSMTTPSNATIMTTAKGIPAAGMDMSMGKTTIAAAIATADKRRKKTAGSRCFFMLFPNPREGFRCFFLPYKILSLLRAYFRSKQTGMRIGLRLSPAFLGIHNTEQHSYFCRTMQLFALGMTDRRQKRVITDSALQGDASGICLSPSPGP